jgi:hypothetical protein
MSRITGRALCRARGSFCFAGYRSPITTNEAVEAGAEPSERWPGHGAQTLNPAVVTDGGLDRADVIEVLGMRRTPHGPPLEGVTSVLGAVTATVKRLEQDRDAEAVYRTDHPRRLPGRADVGREGLRAVPARYPVRPPAQEP